MALVDPNIALSFKQPNFQPTNALAQYAQIANIQNAMQSQQMNQLKMEEYQRARQEGEDVRNYLTKTPDIMTNPEARTPLMGFGESGRKAFTGLTAADQAATAQRTSAQNLAEKTEQAYRNILPAVGTKPEAIKFLMTMINDPAVAGHPITKVPLMDLVARIPEDPEGLKQWAKRFAIGATAWAEKTMPQFFAQDLGNVKQIQQVDPATGQATVVPGSSATVGQSPANVIAERQANLAQQKFTYEKANPGRTLEQDRYGNLFSISTINPNDVKQIMVGGAPAGGAPAGGAPAGGAPAGGAPAGGAPAGGMDTPAAGGATPFAGKEQQVPEGYAKQALGVLNTDGALIALDDKLKNFTVSDMANPAARASLGSAHAITLLYAKELFNLGVLNGGDERIINAVINNPIDFNTTVIPIDAIKKQAKDLRGVIDRSNKNLARVYGKKPYNLSGGGGEWKVVK